MGHSINRYLNRDDWNYIIQCSTSKTEKDIFTGHTEKIVNTITKLFDNNEINIVEFVKYSGYKNFCDSIYIHCYNFQNRIYTAIIEDNYDKFYDFIIQHWFKKYLMTQILSGHFLKIFNEFTNQVKEKKYNRLDYKLWKKLRDCLEYKNFCEVISLNFIKSNTITLYNDSIYMDFKINDGSFGAYLYDLFKDIAPITTNEPKAIVGYGECPLDRIKANVEQLSFSMDEVSVNANTLTNKLNELSNKINNIDKENEKMKGLNFDFGTCENDNVKVSMYGLAIKNAAGTYVSYNKGQIIDVDIFNFDGGKYLFKMPVAIKDIKVGDVVVHNRVPMFVTSLVNGDITVTDIRAGEVKQIIPTTNMFGFNFITKIVSLFDSIQGAPTADNPFGNFLPLIMLNDSKDVDTSTLLMMTMMGQGGAFDFSKNPMMAMLLLGDKGNMKDMILPMMLMNQNGGCGCCCSHDSDRATPEKNI